MDEETTELVEDLKELPLGHVNAWENANWPWVSIQQKSPDQEIILGEFFFLVCPSCGDMIPPGPEGDEQRFRKVHEGHHERNR